MMISKIADRHLSRQACIYIRQSTPGQVRFNPESTERQYNLANKAKSMGWNPEQIRILDVQNLARSGSLGKAPQQSLFRGKRHVLTLAAADRFRLELLEPAAVIGHVCAVHRAQRPRAESGQDQVQPRRPTAVVLVPRGRSTGNFADGAGGGALSVRGGVWLSAVRWLGLRKPATRLHQKSVGHHDAGEPRSRTRRQHKAR